MIGKISILGIVQQLRPVQDVPSKNERSVAPSILILESLTKVSRI